MPKPPRQTPTLTPHVESVVPIAGALTRDDLPPDDLPGVLPPGDPPAAKGRAAPRRRTSVPSSRAPEPPTREARKSQTCSVRPSVWGRAKAAFQRTQWQTGETAFSDLIETAIEREVARREAEYNGGEPYEPHDGPARVGRPMKRA